MNIKKYAREFAARQKARLAMPLWVRLASLVTVVPSFLATIFLLLAGISFAHSVVHATALLRRDPGPAIGSALVAAFLWGVPLGLMLANGVIWMIPPLRRAHERAFADAPKALLKDGMRQLIQFTLIVSPVVLISLVLAIWDPWR